MPSLNDDVLTTLAWVKRHPSLAKIPELDDDELRDLINTYSRAIRHFTGREFAPMTPADDADPPVERLFDWSGEGSLNLEPYEARAITAVKIYVDDHPAVELVAADWRPGPRHRSDEGTYFWVSIQEHRFLQTPLPYWTSASFAPYGIGVTGRWGAGAAAGAADSRIPPDVDRACRIAVANAYRNPEGFASRRMGEFDVVEEVAIDVEGGPGELSLPKDARNLLGPYRRPKARRRWRSAGTA
jgi:hypothetical protein